MATGILPIHQRMAELYMLNKQRQLTPDEMMEMQHCLTENVKYCWKVAYLENMSLMASMTNDVDWHHEICLDIDALPKYKPTKRRKPPKPKKSKGGDTDCST